MLSPAPTSTGRIGSPSACRYYSATDCYGTAQLVARRTPNQCMNDYRPAIGLSHKLIGAPVGSLACAGAAGSGVRVLVTDVHEVRRRATRFFWGWLIVSSGFSIAANVGHALLIIQHKGSVFTASAAVLAVAPPLVQIAATHSISQLVRTRAGGKTYKSALAMTVIVGGFAFTLSFVAIRSLATFLGFTEQVLGVPVASIFPLAIDVSIGHATLCLLSLSTPGPAFADSSPDLAADATRGSGAPAGVGRAESGLTHVSAERVQRRRPATADVAAVAQRPAVTGPRSDGPLGRALAAVGAPLGPVVGTEFGGEADGDLLVIAARIVQAKITTKAPEVVAELLADRVAGMAPTAIAKKNDVHHSVVRKVLEFADPELRAS
jgi:hypothetical protein